MKRSGLLYISKSVVEIYSILFIKTKLVSVNFYINIVRYYIAINFNIKEKVFALNRGEIFILYLKIKRGGSFKMSGVFHQPFAAINKQAGGREN